MLKFDDLMRQGLKFFLVQVGDVFSGKLVLITELLDDFGKLGILFDEFFDVLFEFFVLPDEILDVNRMVE